MPEARLTPALSPAGRLRLVEAADAPALDPALADRLGLAFAAGTGAGLLHLGAVEVGQALPPALAWWRDFAGRVVTAHCTRPDDARAPVPPPDGLADLAATCPFMPGAEYASADLLGAIWAEIDATFRARLDEAGANVQDLLRDLNPAWHVVGRVHFNLAENRRDPESPFAFLATYTTRLSAHGKAQHLPLGRALQEYAGSENKEALLSLLVPVQRAAEGCGWLAEMVARREIFHPLRWSAADAFRLLGDAEALERAGVVVRLPATWRGGRPPRARVTATVGAGPPSVLGMGALLDFRTDVTLDGEPLTAEEIRAILAGQGGLALIRGQWVEVDPTRLRRTLDRFARIERLAAERGLPFADAMRLLAGADIGGTGDGEEARDWAGVVAGPWMAEVLGRLRAPQRLDRARLEPGLRGTLRPYQEVGVRWLELLAGLGLGACLADDMGLGKTIQVLALLLLRRAEGHLPRRPSLLVAPASLLANWAAEIARFTPDLEAMVAHTSAVPAAALKAPALDGVDLVVTSYGTLQRHDWMQSGSWDLVVLDEAQAIKNPDTRQARIVRKLDARARIALTGTPVENRAGDLWSIFEFINPGLLGSRRQFTDYTRRLGERGGYGPLRDLVRPYVLRRLKTDRTVIADLPDKTEVTAYCHLSRVQAALYQEAVKDLTERLAESEGIARRGLVLAALMRFKQICNHPSQWVGDGAWAEQDSGKWARLREIAEVVASRQEKVLVFTQFREVTDPLAAFLGSVFGRSGLVLHGATSVRHRQELVRRFQEDDTVPFFVLSLKAGGSGLNLTAASHVVHFDRWWNPAVENQATDRAFRIGQTRNVLVHKFLCRGTVEEAIDQLIESKRQLSRDLLEGGAEVDLTAMSDEDLLRIVSLDLNRALQE